MPMQKDDNMGTEVTVIDGEYIFGQFLYIRLNKSDFTDTFVFEPQTGNEFVQDIKVAEQFDRSYREMLILVSTNRLGVCIIWQFDYRAITSPQPVAFEAP